MNLRTLRVFTAHESYMSISRTAQDLHAIVGKLCQGVHDPCEADVSILHHAPLLLQQLLRHAPALQRTYVIGYLVWEASHLPAAMLESIRMLDEIWTPSAYCHGIFSAVHPRVTWVPHVVERDGQFTAEDIAFWDHTLPAHPGSFDFLTITRHGDLRKNLRVLVEAFCSVAARIPEARLIIKDQADGRYGLGVHKDGPIVRYVGHVTAHQLNALYHRCQVYVSPHCSEGWGLPMSDAMLMGKLVVATAYSGNLDFMTPYNSLLVPASEEPIRPADTYYYFKAPMRWAYVHREALEAALLSTYSQTGSGVMADRVAQARADVRFFDRQHLTWHIKQRLRQIHAGLRDRTLSRVGQRGL